MNTGLLALGGARRAGACRECSPKQKTRLTKDDIPGLLGRILEQIPDNCGGNRRVRGEVTRQLLAREWLPPDCRRFIMKDAALIALVEEYHLFIQEKWRKRATKAPRPDGW